MNTITLAAGILAHVEKMGFSEAMLVAVAGIVVVMLELAVLTVLILMLSKILRSIEGKITGSVEEAPVPALTVASAAPAAVASAPAAPVAVNNPVLVDVDERSAAVIMAIVSNETGIPLNQLSFKSIKEVK